MDTEETPFDPKMIESINEKALQNQFFTPDNIYCDLSLLKDIPLGIMYLDKMLQGTCEEDFNKFQQALHEKLFDYQKRTYDTIDPYFSSLGYTDDLIYGKLNRFNHDLIFALAPKTAFLSLIIRHIAVNQNHSHPANKHVKAKIDDNHYRLESLTITFYFNTYPLNLSHQFLTDLGREFGETLGVNIKFINKDPKEFDDKDWQDWLKSIDCFYLNSLGRLTKSPLIIEKQSDLSFMGVFFFARKRFEKDVETLMKEHDFDHQIQLITAQLDMMCDFNWLPNNDVRLIDDPSFQNQEHHDVMKDEEAMLSSFRKNA